MSIRARPLSIWLFIYSFLIFITPVHAEKSIAVETALPIIEALEGQIQVLRYKVDLEEGTLARADDFDSLTLAKNWQKASVVFEPVSGRYRVEIEGISKWVQGTAPFLARRHSFTFDGKTAMSFDQQKAGEVFAGPDEFPGFGFIKSAAERADIVASAETSFAVAHFPHIITATSTYVFPPTTSYLSQHRPLLDFSAPPLTRCVG